MQGRIRASRVAGRLLTIVVWLAVTQTGSPAAQTTADKNPSLEAHIGRGNEALQNQQYSAAATEFEQARALDPLQPQVLYKLAICRLALGQLDQSRKLFDMVQGETGGDASAAYYLARLDLLQRQPQAAIRRLVPIAKKPPAPDVLYYLGLAYQQTGDLGAAEQWLTRAASIDPRDFRVFDHLARIYRQQGRMADAQREWTRMSEVHEDELRGSRLALECSQALTAHAQGRDVNTTAAGSSRPAPPQPCTALFVPTDPDKLAVLGTLYGRNGDYTDALTAWKQAARLDPDSWENQHNLGLTYFRLGQFRDARAPLERAVELNPDYFSANALLGATLYALHEDTRAANVLNAAHRLNPADADTAKLLYDLDVKFAHDAFESRDYLRSLDFLQKAARLQPLNPAVHHQIAVVDQALGRASDANREQELARRLQPEQ